MSLIERSCYWLADRTYSPSAPLEGRHQADIAVVGAGYTGLWTALFLKELDSRLDVVVIERHVAGHGASGRNAGIVGESIDHSHALAIAHFGLEEARRLAEIGRQNLAEMRQLIESAGFDCELELSGRLYVALTEGQLDEARRMVDTAELIGSRGYRLLSAEETRRELNSPLYVGGVFAPDGGTVHPIKLIDGLKREAERRGVKFFENTRVQSMKFDGSGATAHTQAGSLAARKIILATSAYTHLILPSVLHRFIPLYDYMTVSEPLTADQLAAIGWKNRQGVTDGRAFFNYYRLTRDNRIVWGTSEAMYYRPNRVDDACDFSQYHDRSLRESFSRHFPALDGLRFPYSWGGAICATTRLTPFFGERERGRLLYGLGFTGHGIGSTRLAGKILAHMALGIASPLMDLTIVRRRPFPYPPEPFRSLAVNAVTHALRRVDAGGNPSLLLRALDRLGIGFSS